uniref:Uncharacterized protein n=1 Tax=Arion vulgaris TaxID=1028688 RepID=A0A0B7ALP8_9EUPU
MGHTMKIVKNVSFYFWESSTFHSTAVLQSIPTNDLYFPKYVTFTKYSDTLQNFALHKVRYSSFTKYINGHFTTSQSMSVSQSI